MFGTSSANTWGRGSGTGSAHQAARELRITRCTRGLAHCERLGWRRLCGETRATLRLCRHCSKNTAGIGKRTTACQPDAGFDDGTHQRLRRRGTPRRAAGTDFGDRGERVSNSQPASVQNKLLASPRIQPEHERWRMGSGWRSHVTFLVARPAIGRLWPGRRIECRSAQGS